MNKLKEIYRDFRDFPALIVSVVLAMAILVFFGYIFYVMDATGPKTENETGTASLEKKAEGALAQRDKTEEDKNIPDQEAEELKFEIVFDDGNAKILANEDLTDFEVWNGEMKAGEIKTERRSQVKIFRKMEDATYLGVEDSGIGDYIPFGGPREIYKLDLKEKSLDKIFDKDNFVSDISQDGKKLVSVESFYVKDDMHTYLNVYNLDTYESDSYQISGEYGAAGNAFFSRDGEKLVYEAAMNDSDNEAFAMFVIDLATGEQTQIGGNDSYNKAKEWAQDN